MNLYNQNQQFPVMDEQNYWDFEAFNNANDGSFNPLIMSNSPYKLNQQNINMLNNEQFLSHLNTNNYINTTQNNVHNQGIIDNQLNDVHQIGLSNSHSNNSTIDSSSPSTIKSPINGSLSGPSNGQQVQASPIKPEIIHDSLKLNSNGPPSKKQRSSSSKSTATLSAQEQRELELVNKDDSELTEQELYMKRKAQNRAAQRAFRERKEHKLKELEAKLNQSEEQRTKLLGELEEMKQKNISVVTENEILKTNGNFNSYPKVGNQISQTNSTFTFPKSEVDFVNSLVAGKKHKITKENYKLNYREPASGSQVLTVGAVWDYLMKRSEEDDLDIDIISVMSKLKGNEKCHGYGPAYPLELVEHAIRESLN